jgi:hypothetical protein
MGIQSSSQPRSKSKVKGVKGHVSCLYSDTWHDHTGDMATPQGATWTDRIIDWATHVVQSRVDKWHPSGSLLC